MATRRHFLVGALASATLPAATWAEAGAPSHLTAARDPSGDYALYGIGGDGSLRFRVPLPDRGHAAAAHPTAPEAVAFARRPGRFALVIDCASGAVLHRLDAPEGAHFYGHGAFSMDGDLLFTTENIVETGEGRIGVWSRSAGYTRIDSFASHGIGPHEIIRLPDQNVLAVANGGILTHPDKGREKLNLDTMRPNLVLIGEDGRLRDLAEVPQDIHRNSLRHIAAMSDGRVACALQWQGDVFDAPPLLAIYDAGTLRFVEMPDAVHLGLKAYAGSVAVLRDDAGIALTSPVGGSILLFDRAGTLMSSAKHRDICGVGPAAGGGMATDGQGRIYSVGAKGISLLAHHALSFDNHLVPVG